MSRHEKIAYAVAVMILVVGGAIVRTAILNWIVGPLIVVMCVAVAERISTARRNGAATTNSEDES